MTEKRMSRPACALLVLILLLTALPDGVSAAEKESGVIRVLLTRLKLTDRLDVSLDGSYTLNGISFSASDTSEAKAEALREAVADAKNKADVLAEASGLKITGIESLSEDGVFSYENTVGNVYAKMAVAETADAGTVVQAAKLIVSASVSITYSAE